MTMRTPTVTEITAAPEPVVHDTFIDDLTPAMPPLPSNVRWIRLVRAPRPERPDSLAA
jgi:hypothetical protein